jgi:hypothetical protein
MGTTFRYCTCIIRLSTASIAECFVCDTMLKIAPTSGGRSVLKVCSSCVMNASVLLREACVWGRDVDRTPACEQPNS